MSRVHLRRTCTRVDNVGHALHRIRQAESGSLHGALDASHRLSGLSTCVRLYYYPSHRSSQRRRADFPTRIAVLKLGLGVPGFPSGPGGLIAVSVCILHRDHGNFHQIIATRKPGLDGCGCTGGAAVKALR